MKPVLKTRLRFLGRNLKKAERLSREEKRKLYEVFDEKTLRQMYGAHVDRSLLYLLHDMKHRYVLFTNTIHPLVGEYKTLITVLEQKSNYSSEVFDRYQGVLQRLQRQKNRADILIQEMKQVKQYIEVHQHFTAKQFHDECKLAFGKLQRDFVKVYEPIMNITEAKK